VYAFSYLLAYSRRQYVRFVESQDFATTIREHVRAFDHLGGLAATCLYDNMKVVVTGYDARRSRAGRSTVSRKRNPTC
jgi:transposase